jgi:hypothetical protein
MSFSFKSKLSDSCDTHAQVEHLEILRTGQRSGSKRRNQQMVLDKQTIRNCYEDIEIDVGTQKPFRVC